MLSFSPSNQLFSGLNGNILRSTRNSYKNRIVNNAVLQEQSLQDTIRSISFLSKDDIQVLVEKSVNQLNVLLKENDLNEIPNLEENIALAYKIIQQDSVTKSGLYKTRILQHKPVQSPYLVPARSFCKTANLTSRTSYKPLLQGSEKSDEGLNGSLKKLGLGPAETNAINDIISKINKSNEPNQGAVRKLVPTFVLYSLLFATLFLIIRLANGRSSPFGIDPGNQIAPEEIEVTFADVKGCDEAKGELQEVVEFLINPEKFSKLGGRLPKGCLLVGPPGTGKTLLARAVAGEAKVPFFHMAGPEFDEVLVGQGASRVRNLFKVARSKAPCVIFIDEIDSVGSKRSNSSLHPYANQTINQLLSEMDGFMSSEGVIVLGATNRADDLDKALLRPGRFDTQVQVPNPDIKGRRDILTLYLARILHDNTIDVEKLARMTVGFSGADLENMVNTAAIKAAVDKKSAVGMDDFEYSHDKHVLGTDWKSRVRDKEDLTITAYHEAGHTLVAYFTKDATPIHKVTIVAKGQSGGHTAFIPEKDSWHETKAQMLASMDVGMGGRAAEELIFGEDKVTGGAYGDLKTTTEIAEYMVNKLGMSQDVGLRIVQKDELAPASKELVDQEINKLLEESYKRAVHILTKHRDELDLLAENLLQYETLDSDDLKTIIENKKPTSRQSNSTNDAKLYSPRKPISSGGSGLGAPVGPAAEKVMLETDA